MQVLSIFQDSQIDLTYNAFQTFKNYFIIQLNIIMPENVMLGHNDIAEELSYAYIHAIASQSGFSFEIIRKDRDSIDATIRAKGTLSSKSKWTSPSLDIQAKATTNLTLVDGNFSFSLLMHNYNELKKNRSTPAILVVLFLPEKFEDWLHHTEESLITKKCAYWVSLKDAPDSNNETSITIHVPKSNVFSPETLTKLLTNISEKGSI